MSNESHALTLRETTDLAPVADTRTAGVAAMARVRAEVEAFHLMAERHPRNALAVRQRLLTECDRTSFAEVALYSLPRGGKRIEGLSIRFAETARRLMQNMLADVAVTDEDDERLHITVTAIDFEANAIERETITVPKTIERRSPKAGDEVLRRRTNSTGELVYLIRATDDDMRVKRRAETQRAKRNAILALIPGDLLDECKTRIRATRELEIARDPDAARKRIADAFAELGVPVAELHQYLGHDLASASPAELDELAGVHLTVRDGEHPWHLCLAAKTGIAGDGKPDPHAALRADVAAKAARVGQARARKAGKTAPTQRTSEPERAVAPPADYDGPPPEYQREPGED